MTSKERYATRKIAALIMVNGTPTCKQCGYDKIRALQFDHIKPVGNRNARKNNTDALRGGASMIKAILTGIQDITELQVLCANCHCLKED